MSKIKFRGINAITGKWVYGGFVKINNLPYIVPFNSNTNISIRPETIGQSTGLKDKNGVEIYKGDKIIYAEDIYSKEKALVTWIDNEAVFALRFESGELLTFIDISNFECEVIGNIHEDNL